MTQIVIALLGISGVGKTTFLRKLLESLQFQQLQASALIKEGREIAENAPIDIDSLRSADIDQNQKYLTAGFVQAVDPDAKIVILDGHSVIDTPNGLVPIEAVVFSQLGIKGVIFLADDPAQVILRRQGDLTRNRPVRDLSDLTKYQDISLLNSVKICRELMVPLIVVNNDQCESVIKLIECFSM